jgi:hypothetical protein
VVVSLPYYKLSQTPENHPIRQELYAELVRALRYAIDQINQIENYQIFFQ